MAQQWRWLGAAPTSFCGIADVDFSFSEEQGLLRDSLAAYLRDHYDFEARRSIARSRKGWSSEVWHGLAADLGILGLGLPERVGGLDDPVGLMLVMQELGRVLLVEPYLESVVIAGKLLAMQESERADAVLTGLIGGELIPVVAWPEPDAGDIGTEGGSLCAISAGGKWELSGLARVVKAAPWATHFLVFAKTPSDESDGPALSLFIIDARTPGVRLEKYSTVDGGQAADVYFDRVCLPMDALLGEAGSALPALERIRCSAIAAQSAEAVGLLETLCEDSVNYCQQRAQFGQAIGQFQSVQHRLVDMHLQIEMCRSAAYRATLSLSGDELERGLAVSSAKVTVAKACRFIGQNAVQLHGGMGMTDELRVSHYFKRATLIEREFGGADFYLRRYAQLRRAP